jgi:tetratricopeptide (TPR) repeat protein
MSQHEPKPALEPWSLGGAEALALLLSQALPPEHQAYAARIRSLLLALGTGPAAPGANNSRIGADPQLRAALATLLGHRIAHQGYLIRFEQAQTDDISVGGDRYNVVIAVPTLSEHPAPFRFPLQRGSLFRGRAAELAELERLLLAEPKQHVVISGIGGVGKTWLATEFAYRYRDRFPGGVFGLTIGHPDTIEPQVASWAEGVGPGLEEREKRDLGRRIEAVLADWADPAPRLVVLDSFEDPALLDRLLPGAGGARLLITSRVGFWPADLPVTVVALQPLPRDESVELLLAPRNLRLGPAGITAAPEPPQRAAAHQICDLLGDLPLALALAGAYLARSPHVGLGAYRERLRTQLIAHRSLAQPLSQRTRSVTVSIGLSYGRLEPDDATDAAALQLLQRAALLSPTLLPPGLLARLTGRGLDDLEQVEELDLILGRLAQVGLADWLPEGEIVVHRLIAAYVRDMGLGEAGVEAVWPEAAAAVIDEAARIADEGASKDLLPLLPHLRALASTERPIPEATRVRLLKELGRYLWQAGAPAEACPWLEQALSICAGSGELRGSDLHGRFLNYLALALQDQGDDAAAHELLVQALAIQERLYMGRHELVAGTLDNLAVSLERLGQGELALAAYRRAQKLRRQLFGKEHPHYADSLGNLAGLYLDKGRLGRAERLFQAALRIYSRHYGSNHGMAALALHNLGEVSLTRTEYGQAASRLEQALQIWNDAVAQDHLDRADTLLLLAEALDLQAVELLASEDDGQSHALAERLLARALNYAAEAHRIYAATLGGDNPATVASDELLDKILTGKPGEDDPTQAVTVGGR